jgi:lysophospholipid acyltransferase (LPLAT)-like uncharacterized protein
MKIRRPWLIKVVAFAAAWVIRLWMGTLQYRYRPIGPNVDPWQLSNGDRYIYAIWHETLLVPAYQYGKPDIWVLISQHADGQFIAEVCRHLRFRTVRGSTTRGGVQAVRHLIRVGRTGHLAVTPDGPRGPRRQVQPGLVYLAARTGLPIVPIGIGFQRAWRMQSWDRFALPQPWSLTTCVTAPPIAVPAAVDREQLEHYRRQVEDAMRRATAAAERLAA